MAKRSEIEGRTRREGAMCCLIVGPLALDWLAGKPHAVQPHSLHRAARAVRADRPSSQTQSGMMVKRSEIEGRTRREGAMCCLIVGPLALDWLAGKPHAVQPHSLHRAARAVRADRPSSQTQSGVVVKRSEIEGLTRRESNAPPDCAQSRMRPIVLDWLADWWKLAGDSLTGAEN